MFNLQSQKDRVMSSVAAVARESAKQEHAEGSAACHAKHAFGACQGYQPGKKHAENPSKSKE